MSRGYKRQAGFSAREYDYDDVEPTVKPTKAMESAVGVIRKSKAVKEDLEVLFENIVEQQRSSQGGDEYARDRSKENKLRIAEFFKKLPPEVQKAISLPETHIKKLYRGVKDREITVNDKWKNGSFVYGFSPDKGVASSFSIGPSGSVLSSKNIESFGGIIDVTKVHDLVQLYNKRLWGDDKGWSNQFREPSQAGWRSKSESHQKKYMLNRIFEEENGYEDEQEVIVFDIKFKPGVFKYKEDKL